MIGSGLMHCNEDNFDQTFSGFCFQVWGPKHITVLCLPQHEISSLPGLREPPQQAASITISPGQKQTLGHGFFMVQRHLWVQINLSWQRNQLPSSSLRSSYISSSQLYFIFSLPIHLCMPIGSRNPSQSSGNTLLPQKPHRKQGMRNISCQHNAAHSGGL